MKFSKEEIQKQLKEDFTYWYHKINLGNGIITPGFNYDPLWDNIRSVREQLDYSNKYVLDIASFDGLWSFEAEQLGAEIVIATDCLYRSFRNFLFCKNVLNSNCIPYFNISPYNLFDRLDVYFQENYDDEKPYDRLFDIVQHLGLLYHLRDPLLSLSQARTCIKTDGTLIIESNIVLDVEESFMVYNGIPFTYRISKNFSVWWIPSITCLKEMLMATFFTPIEDSISIIDYHFPLMDKDKSIDKRSHKGIIEKQYKIGRVCMLAKASNPDNYDKEFYREMQRSFRNPGLARLNQMNL